MHEEQEKERSERRARRSVTNDASKTYDTCQLALVADHLFFEHMGQRKRSTAINYMVCFKNSTFSKILPQRSLKDMFALFLYKIWTQKVKKFGAVLDVLRKVFRMTHAMIEKMCTRSVYR